MNKEKEGEILMTYKLGKVPINQELALHCFWYINMIQELKLSLLLIYNINHSL